MPDDIDIKAKPVQSGTERTPERAKDDPTVRASRQAMHRRDDGEAFLPDPSRSGGHINANDGESFGEEFLASATTGEPVQMDAADEVLEEEEGGPFLELDADGTTGEDSQDAEALIAEEAEVSAPRPRNVSRSLSR